MNPGLADDILAAIRRIIRGVDLHSRHLSREYGLTGPQAVLLKEVVNDGPISVGELAQRLSISQGTVTDIVARLESRELLKRERGTGDKRRVIVTASAAGRRLAANTGSLLQERFIERLKELQEWERNQLLSSLQRIAAMMEADELTAAPVLTTEQLGPNGGAEASSPLPSRDAPRGDGKAPSMS